jgi:hypothetical protein
VKLNGEKNVGDDNAQLFAGNWRCLGAEGAGSSTAKTYYDDY